MNNLPPMTTEQRAKALEAAHAKRHAESELIKNLHPITNDLEELWLDLAEKRGVKLPGNLPITHVRIRRFLRALGLSSEMYYRSMGEPLGKGGLMEYSRLNPDRGMRQFAGQLLEGISSVERPTSQNKPENANTR